MDDATPIVDARSKPPQRFRRTRIAVSAFFGVLAVAFVMLWIRSYWFDIGLSLQFVDAPDGYYFPGYQGASMYCGGGKIEFDLSPCTPGFSGTPFPAGIYVSQSEYDREFDEHDLTHTFGVDDVAQIPRLFGISRLHLYWDEYDGAPLIHAPIWLMIAATVTCAGAVWLLPTIAASRQYSLRTLLIATTLVAVVLGLVCYTVR